MVMTERQTVTERFGPRPTLVDFLNVQPGEVIEPVDFAISAEPQAGFVVTVRKLQDIPDTKESVEVSRLQFTDMDIEEASTWNDRALDHLIGIPGRDKKEWLSVRKANKGLSSINVYVTRSIALFLSEGNVTVNSIYSAPYYKISRYDVLHTPDFIEISRYQEQPDGSPSTDILTITAVRFKDASSWFKSTGSNAQVLGRNLESIAREYDLFIQDRHVASWE